jgi:hypothetical protein
VIDPAPDRGRCHVDGPLPGTLRRTLLSSRRELYH